MKKIIVTISTTIVLLLTLFISPHNTFAASTDCAVLLTIPGISSADYHSCMQVEGNYDSTKNGSENGDPVTSTDCSVLLTIPGISSADYHSCMQVEGNYDSTKGSTSSTGEGISGSSGKAATFSGTCEYFLGMVSWSCKVDISDQANLKKGIWIIISNIASDITIAASYLIIAYVIYGGYLYIFSRGEPAKVAEGKKTLTQAFIGLGITLTASLIMGSIRIALVGSGGNIGNCATAENACVTPDDLVFNLINWFIGIAGVISVIFLIYGGILYIISTGNPDRIRQAKNMIMYSLIGLAIITLSATITAFVSSTIRKSAENAHYNLIFISKEVNEIHHS